MCHYLQTHYPFQTWNCMLYRAEGNGYSDFIKYGTSLVPDRELTVWRLLDTTYIVLFRSLNKGWYIHLQTSEVRFKCNFFRSLISFQNSLRNIFSISNSSCQMTSLNFCLLFLRHFIPNALVYLYMSSKLCEKSKFLYSFQSIIKW